jgi:hypothetical protein
MTTDQENILRNLILLKTSGYEIRFYLVELENSRDRLFHAKVEFITTPNVAQKISALSEKALIKLNDLIELKKYFKDHMENLRNKPQDDSYVFVDHTLSYQIHALCGDVDKGKEEGCFSIVSMVNIGKTYPTKDSTYIGGESTITFQQVEEFIVSIDNLVSGQPVV